VDEREEKRKKKKCGGIKKEEKKEVVQTSTIVACVGFSQREGKGKKRRKTGLPAERGGKKRGRERGGFFLRTYIFSTAGFQKEKKGEGTVTPIGEKRREKRTKEIESAFYH